MTVQDYMHVNAAMYIATVNQRTASEQTTLALGTVVPYSEVVTIYFGDFQN